MIEYMKLIIQQMYVLIANMLDTTIKTADEIERELKLPVLASIPMYDFDAERKGKSKGGKKR